MSNTPNFEYGVAKDSKTLRDKIKAIEIQISNNQELETDQLAFIEQSFGQLWQYGQLKILAKNGRPSGSESLDMSIIVLLSMHEVFEKKTPVIKTLHFMSDRYGVGFQNLRQAYYKQKKHMKTSMSLAEQKQFVKYAVACYESVKK